MNRSFDNRDHWRERAHQMRALAEDVRGDAVRAERRLRVAQCQ
jgi:hypothetical protein